MPTIGERFRRSWNAFIGRDPTKLSEIEYGWGSGYRPDKVRLSRTNAQSIVGFIYNRIAIDVASIDIRHVRINEVEKFNTRSKHRSIGQVFQTGSCYVYVRLRRCCSCPCRLYYKRRSNKSRTGSNL